MTPNDFHVYVPVEERETLMTELKDYRIWEEDSNEDTLLLQGHPGMSEVLKDKFSYNFSECYGGCVRDLWISHSYVNGEWTESYECDEHHDGSGWSSITLEEFNTLFDRLHEV